MTVQHAYATERSTRAQSLGHLLLRAAERYDGAALRYKRDGRWVDISYPALGAAAREIARGLVALGIEPGDHVAILSETRPEWTLADAGTRCDTIARPYCEVRSKCSVRTVRGPRTGRSPVVRLTVTSASS